MTLDPSMLAVSWLFLSVLTIGLSLPLILRWVKMNGVYGVRIPESFRSPERWYQINRFGGVLLLLWGVAVGITGAIGLGLDAAHGPRYGLISLGVVMGGAVSVLLGILSYAAMTRKP